MPRDREHLALPEWGGPAERRRRQPPPRPPSRNRGEAGRRLLVEAEDLLNRLQETQRTYPEGFNPANIFRLDLEAAGDLDEAVLGRSGLRLLAKDPYRALVVVTDDQLTALRERLRNYAGQVPGGPEYGELDVVRSMSPLSAQDRMGRRLVAEPLQPDQETPCDIELWHTGRRPDCEHFIATVQAVLVRHNIPLSDRWIGTSICVCRARLREAALRELLEMPEIKEVDRPPRPAFQQAELFQADVSGMEIAQQGAPDLVGIVVLDSGLASRHPLIAPALGDAQVFPDALGRRVLDGPNDGTEKGHGTGVCGIAAYGDVLGALRERRFVPSARVFSARVTDDNNEYDQDILLEHQLEQAIEYFLSNYPAARVVNLSLGDRNQVYADGYQTRFAAAIDDLAYRYSERGILLVVSSGNYDDVPLPPEMVKRFYPNYLDQPHARLIEPATAALALTVGGLALGPVADRNFEKDVQLPIAGDAGFPSPFTRLGPGVDGAIKPELVETAGDWILERDRLTDSGVVTLGKNFAGGPLLVSRIGTSFAAPKVANTAAQLMRRYPEYSSNLIRALIVHSAEVPLNRPSPWAVPDPTDEVVMKVYGYGQPDLGRAIAAAQNEPWLLHDGRIEGDTFRLFQLPELPEEFLARPGRRRLKVTLAFDPPTRPTRKDSYLGFTMEFALFRNVDAATLTDAYRKWDRDEKQELEDGAPPGRTELNHCNLKLLPGSTLRKKGTVQSAWLEFSRPNWKYGPGTPLFLVVVCERRWAPREIEGQRFAVVMSLSHEDAEVDLHARIQQRVGLFVRQRARV